MCFLQFDKGNDDESQGALGLQSEAPIYHRARVLWARDGYASEMREIWSDDRRLLALDTKHSRQRGSFIIKPVNQA